MLRRKQVEEKIGLGASAIYAKLTYNPKRPNEHDPTFPRPVKIGKNAVAWIESEIEAWIDAQIEKSRREAA